MDKKEEKDKIFKLINIGIALTSLFSIMFLLWTQLNHINSFASTWDQVDFALALDRYDLMAMQPHFPGYPYFILGGYFIHQFVDNKVASLTVFNILFYFSALYPIYKLSRIHVSRLSSLVIASIIYSSTYVMVMVNQPISEGAALAALWWYLWSLHLAMKGKGVGINILPPLLLSILLGIRLSYLPFAVGLLLLFYKKWKNGDFTFKQIVRYSIFAIMCQLIWVGALVFSEGSVKGFVKLSLAFTSGHFNDWGNSAVASDVSFLERIKTLIFHNVLWTGISAQKILLAVLYGIVVSLFIYQWKRGKFKQEFTLHLVWIMGICYLIWAVVAQNIDKPRHILPLVIFFLFILLIHVLKDTRNSLLYIICYLLIISQTYYSSRLIEQQAKELPATYQLGNYLQSLDDSAVVYAWEETRVLQYMNVTIPSKKVQTYQVFLHDKSYYHNRKILITNKVVEGFAAQGIDLTGKIKKIKEFHSNSIFDPVYNHIVLYEWRNEY
ncbi:hypothetical protein [Cytobacillus dafuensis]|uniref:Glycosyltransferase RgtA/B/C/D-like domain-containing protein n=1 Tax=Cytobacillus dafuensis TaxID=1742359 RepID=A0A5B8YZT2_CYTDA|nr:hypothetical protein [Cytobacillus dafuensis]QED46041.1 hypothetical protein FSZ17_01255 [Cytobacillus dafuensis]